MFRRFVVLGVFLLIAPITDAQGPEARPERLTSLKQALGVDYPPTALMMKHGGWSKLKTSDGEPHWGKSAGVVIVRANTNENGTVEFTDEYGDLRYCIDATENVNYFDTDLLQATLHSLVFKPKSKQSSLLEIIWSGQVVVNGAEPPDVASIDQKAFLMCSVRQKSESVPCSGTAELPVVVEELTGDGITRWVSYHGYVEFDPKHEVTVELGIVSSLDTFVTICGDTVTLKY
jgi:hypothetical protein